MTLTIRASRVPLALLCAGSVHAPAVQIETESEPANAGTAVHEMLADAIAYGRPDWNSIPEIAAKHRCEEKDLRFLLNGGWSMWQRVADGCYPDPSVEQALEHTAHGLTLTGHTDVMAYDSHVEVLDWKSGRKDKDYSGQLRAYALLGMAARGAPSARATIAWIRDDELERYTMTREAADAWFAGLAKHLLEWDGVYRVGPHCEHCPRAHECPAGQALAKANVEMFAQGGATLALEELSPDELIALLARADGVRRAAEEFRSRVRSLVLARGRTITGSKEQLVFDEHPRRHLRVMQAMPVLREAGLTDHDLNAVLRAQLTDLEGIHAKRAGRGNGAGAVRDLRAKLDAVGAIEYTSVETLNTRRV